MKRVRVEPEAKAELVEATRWYERQRTGLSRRLLDDVETALAAIEALPRRFPRVAVQDESLEIRRCLLRDFPYAVVFILARGEPVVIAVAHVKREPGYWLYRVPRSEPDPDKEP